MKDLLFREIRIGDFAKRIRARNGSIRVRDCYVLSFTPKAVKVLNVVWGDVQVSSVRPELLIVVNDQPLSLRDKEIEEEYNKTNLPRNNTQLTIVDDRQVVEKTSIDKILFGKDRL